MANSGLTALHRTRPSTLARYVVAHHLTRGPIFDWGCGHGQDLEYYHSLGLMADGYDPNHRPDPVPAAYASDAYAFVQCAFVLNVLEAPDRAALLAQVYDFLPAGGTLAIAVRTAQEITKAVGPNWTAQADGWITSKNTFQHGFTPGELTDLLAAAGFASAQVVHNEPLFVLAQKGI